MSTITSLEQDGSPNGEPHGQSGEAEEAASGSADLGRLAKTLTLLREAAQDLSRPVIRRALQQNPATIPALLTDIERSLNKIERAATARRPG